MTYQDRVKAIIEFGFTERQARFLVTVMLHSGACLLRQYTAFAGIVHGQKTRKFFRKLVTRGYATAYACRHHRGRVFHIHNKALYRAIGVTDSRHRRPLSAARVVHGLMLLDAVVANPELIWLATADEKQAHLTAMTPVPADRLPHMSPAPGRSGAVRMFPDKVPIGIDLTGRWVIIYMADEAELDVCRAFLQRHADLLAALPAWTLRFVAPPELETLAASCAKLVKEDLASPVRQEVFDRLKWYFAQRRAHEIDGVRIEDEEMYYLSRSGFRAHRSQVLYKRWLREGDAALEYAISRTIADAIERGSGRVECVILPHQYRHLSPVLGGARGTRRGADDGEQTLHSFGPRSHRPFRQPMRRANGASRRFTRLRTRSSPRTCSASRCSRAAEAGGALCRPPPSRRYSNRGESDPHLCTRTSPRLVFGGRSRPDCSVGNRVRRRGRFERQAGAPTGHCVGSAWSRKDCPRCARRSAVLTRPARSQGGPLSERRRKRVGGRRSATTAPLHRTCTAAIDVTDSRRYSAASPGRCRTTPLRRAMRRTRDQVARPERCDRRIP